MALGGGVASSFLALPANFPRLYTRYSLAGWTERLYPEMVRSVVSKLGPAKQDLTAMQGIKDKDPEWGKIRDNSEPPASLVFVLCEQCWPKFRNGYLKVHCSAG